MKGGCKVFICSQANKSVNMMSKSVSNVIIEPKTAFPLLWASHLIWMLSFIFSKLVVVWELNRVLAFLAACQPLFLIKKKNTMNLFLQLFNLCTCMTNSRHVFGRCPSWTNVNLPSLCFELIHTSSGFQGEKSKGGVKENPAFSTEQFASRPVKFKSTCFTSYARSLTRPFF